MLKFLVFMELWKEQQQLMQLMLKIVNLVIAKRKEYSFIYKYQQKKYYSLIQLSKQLPYNNKLSFNQTINKVN